MKLSLGVTKAEKESEDFKIAVFLNCIGDKALEVYTDLQGVLADPNNKTLAEVLTAFQTHCEPRKNPVFGKYRFWQLKSNRAAGIDDFVTEFRQKAQHCEFGPF